MADGGPDAGALLYSAAYCLADAGAKPCTECHAATDSQSRDVDDADADPSAKYHAGTYCSTYANVVDDDACVTHAAADAGPYVADTRTYAYADGRTDLTKSWADGRADICTHAAGAHACADRAEKLEANAGTSAGAGDVRACSSAYGAHDGADAGALVYGATYGRAERRADETYFGAHGAAFHRDG